MREELDNGLVTSNKTEIVDEIEKAVEGSWDLVRSLLGGNNLPNVIFLNALHHRFDPSWEKWIKELTLLLVDTNDEISSSLDIDSIILSQHNSVVSNISLREIDEFLHVVLENHLLLDERVIDTFI